MQFYTYLHCKPDGTPFYVGKGHGKRAYDFRRGRNRHYKFILTKYGKANIGVFVFPCDSEPQALADEIQQIANLRNEGWTLANIGDGGEANFSGTLLSSEARKVIANKLKGNKHGLGYKHSAEARAKISASGMGNKYALGSKGVLGQRKSDATKAKISASKRGTICSMEHRQKLSEAGRRAWALGGARRAYLTNRN